MLPYLRGNRTSSEGTHLADNFLREFSWFLGQPESGKCDHEILLPSIVHALDRLLDGQLRERFHQELCNRDSERVHHATLGICAGDFGQCPKVSWDLEAIRDSPRRAGGPDGRHSSEGEREAGQRSIWYSY